MADLKDYFKLIESNKKVIADVQTGNEFEQVLKQYLEMSGFKEYFLNSNEFDIDAFVEKNKDFIQKKDGSNLLINDTAEEDIFIYQPYGSQNYPDFLVFTKNMVYSLELKYTNRSRRAPMWNSNLPKKDGIYIFGSAGLKDISFFRGESILPDNERIILNEFFNQLEIVEKFQKDMAKKVKEGKLNFDNGFTPYIRTTFMNSKTINPNANLDYFDKKFKKKNIKELNSFLEWKHL